MNSKMTTVQLGLQLPHPASQLVGVRYRTVGAPGAFDDASGQMTEQEWALVSRSSMNFELGLYGSTQLADGSQVGANSMPWGTLVLGDEGNDPLPTSHKLPFTVTCAGKRKTYSHATVSGVVLFGILPPDLATNGGQRGKATPQTVAYVATAATHALVLIDLRKDSLR